MSGGVKKKGERKMEAIIKIGALLSAFGVIYSGMFSAFRFLERQKQQDKELSAIREELSLLCYGVMSCLDGLRQQGCNHHVTQALEKLDKHLNICAHRGGRDG